MRNDHLHLVLGGTSNDKDFWHHCWASTYGLNCEFGRGESAGSTLHAWSVGEVQLLDARCAHLSFSTIAEGCAPWLYLKHITRGSLTIEQGGRSRSFCAGEMVLVNSARPYAECIAEPTQLVGLRFHPRSLKERGFRHDLSNFVVPNMTAPDVRAVSEMIMSIVGQKGQTSISMRRRQGGQLLDLLDLVIGDSAALTRARSGDATLFRAKRFIAQNLRNPDLTATLIASAVFVSDAHLNRLFRAEGESLMRYVWNCRLALAADMLKRNRKSRVEIREIAYRCGFSTPAHFSRAFKERYGVTPRASIDAPSLAKLTMP